MEAPIRIIVLMGPAGAGKTTIGTALAQSLGWQFLDADDFHSADNVQKMRRGIGLTDDDRAPWLATMRDALARALASDTSVVLACSALKEEYRRALIPANAGSRIRFVYLRADEAVLRERLAHRTGHYAGPQLLASQLETLEEPADALWVDASRSPAEIVSRIRDALALRA
jgi:gluconokinase